MTRAWSIVITGVLEHCDDEGMEHCDEKAMSILMHESWSFLMTRARSIVITGILEHCEDKC